MQKIRKKIVDTATTYINIKNVLARIEKRGQFDKLFSLLNHIKIAEEKDLLAELSDSAHKLPRYSNIFKENLKLVLNVLGKNVILCV